MRKKSVSRETLEQIQLRKVGREFRIKRQDMNLKLLDVEKTSGVSSFTISKLERGQLSNCSLETLNKIATALKVKLYINVIV